MVAGNDKNSALLLSVLFLLLVAGLKSGILDAAPREASGPQIFLSGDISTRTGTAPDTFTGSLDVKGWVDTKGRCLYLPLNDPSFLAGGVSIDYFRYRTAKIDPFSQSHGSIEVKDAPSGRLQWLSPFLIEVLGDTEDLHLEFTTRVRRPLGQGNDAFFDNFHPVLLQNCPRPSPVELSYQPRFDSRIRAAIKAPSGWNLVLPMMNEEDALPSPRLALVLVHNYSEQRISINGLEVVILYRSPGFLELRKTLEMSLESHMEWFGQFPYPRLIIVESSDLEKNDLPGIVTLNTPRQELFSSIQSQILNWNHWIAAKLLAYQWYGSAIRPRTEDDAWLVMGIADFATLTALRKNSSRYNLFNIFDFEPFILSLNYLGAQELTTAFLDRAIPNCQLTDAEGRSVTPAAKQHGYQFLRQAVAMRHLNFVAGEQHFQRFLRHFTQNGGPRAISPHDFRDALSAVPSPFSSLKRSELSQHLNTWWTNGSWPDYQFDGLDTLPLQNGRWIASVRLRQLGSIDFPVHVQVRDILGQTYSGLSVIDRKGAHTVSVVTEHEPESVEIDPQHIFYDSDRFNNSSSRRRINIFPGDAQTFADDAYTVAWLPYIFRRPGENTGMGIQFAVLKYLKSAFFVTLERDFKSKDLAYIIEREDNFPRIGMGLELSVSETMAGHRLARAGLFRKAIDVWGLALRPNAQVRHRAIKASQTPGVTSLAIGLEGELGDLWGCSHNLRFDAEKSEPAAQLSYLRQIAIIDSTCNIFNIFEFDLRLFRGKLLHSDSVSSNLAFAPENLTEARLRLDESNVASSSDISTVTTDILVPISLNLPSNMMVVARKVRGRLFFDAGRALDTKTNYRAAGVGFLLPFGGDLTGVGSLALTRFTALAVLYSSVDREVNQRPRFIFDIFSAL